MCGHPMSECRDPRTAQTWDVTQEVCEPTRVAQAMAENAAEAGKKSRGVVMKTRRRT